MSPSIHTDIQSAAAPSSRVVQHVLHDRCRQNVLEFTHSHPQNTSHGTLSMSFPLATCPVTAPEPSLVHFALVYLHLLPRRSLCRSPAMFRQFEVTSQMKRGHRTSINSASPVPRRSLFRSSCCWNLCHSVSSIWKDQQLLGHPAPKTVKTTSHHLDIHRLPIWSNFWIKAPCFR